MNLSQVKNKILKKTLPDSLIIFVCPDNTFIAEQYLTGIVKTKKKELNTLKKLSDLDSANALIVDYASMINILRTDIFGEFYSDYAALENVIIICNKVDKKIEPLVQDYIVEVPKPSEMHIVDYILTLCPGLDEYEAKELYKRTGGDIYRIDNEVSKIALFTVDKQKEIFTQLCYQDNSDLFSIDSWALQNGLTENNKVKVKEILKHRNTLDLEPLAISSSALAKFKKILFINFESGIKSFESIGVSQKEANIIRTYCKNISIDRLASIIRFLSSINIRLQNGELDMTKNQLVDYIICNIMR